MGGSYDKASQHEPDRTTSASELIVRLRRVLQPEGLDCACRETLDGALDRFDQLERRREARRRLTDARDHKIRIEALLSFPVSYTHLDVYKRQMQLTLGPVLYHWQPERWRDFYFRIADEAPVDTVVVGEAVCSKRTPFKQDHIPAVVERLEAAGKRVLHASLILVSLPRERRQTRELMQAAEAEVEINDLTCLASLGERPFAVGPFVNVYNCLLYTSRCV